MCIRDRYQTVREVIGPFEVPSSNFGVSVISFQVARSMVYGLTQRRRGAEEPMQMHQPRPGLVSLSENQP